MDRKHRRGWSPIQRIRQLAVALLLLVLGSSVALVLGLRWVNPPYSAVMLQRHLDGSTGLRHRWVDLASISPHMQLAVIAAEDQRFPQHWGVDTRELRAAIDQHARGGRLRGASTITQQVARNLFLWQGRSILRKGLELWFSILLELFWPKQRILEMYLNFAEMGSQTFGVGAASQRYFGVEPHALTPGQAALLAAVLPNPQVYRAEAPSAYVARRRDWILGQMRQLGGSSYLATMQRDG